VSRKAARGVWIGCLAALIASLLYGIFRLERWEFASLDARLLWRQENRLRDSDIQTLVVAIDDKTLGMMPNRRWPFPRSEYARLVRVLKDAGARCLGFDLRFEDSDPAEDRKLAAALRAAGNVYLGVRFDPESSSFPGPMENGDALDSSLSATDPEGSARVKLKMESAALVPEVLARSARGLGSITIVPELADGMLRRFPVVAAYVSPDDSRVHLYASLPLMMAADHLGVPLSEIKVRLGDAIEIGDRRIPINESGEMVINYYGPFRGSLPLPSYIDVVEGKYEPRYFRDKIVILGNTLSGGFDIQRTPFGGQYPGVLAQATVVQNILDGSAIRQAWPVVGWLLAFAGALAMGLTRALSFRSQWIAALLLGLAIVVSGALLLYYHFLWIEMVRPLLALFVAFVGVSVSTFREASLARARVQGAVDALAEVAGAIAHARNPAELCQALETGIGRVLGVERVGLRIHDAWMREHLSLAEAPPPAPASREGHLPLHLRGKEVGYIALGPLSAEADPALVSAVANFVGLALENGAFFEESRDHFLSLTLTLADIIESNDEYTAGHCARVMEYATAIGERLGLSAGELEELRYGALLHDVGKTVLDKPVLNKPGALSPEEMAEVRRHPELGRQWLQREKRLQGVSELVGTHHERWDGGGYPRGLAGEEIPLGGRILAAADVWDALTTDRPYRRALTFEEARRFLVEGRGTQFDARVVDAFLAYLAEARDETQGAHEATPRARG
jgi:HD-GYP domain-containing protein (c-di-GMP phosphodiesterase class II)/CHASE2 domain-containing sensor protein